METQIDTYRSKSLPWHPEGELTDLTTEGKHEHQHL